MAAEGARPGRLIIAGTDPDGDGRPGKPHSNAGIAARLVVTEKAVSKHIGNIFAKLDLYPAEDGNRRVLAVLTYLNA